MAQLDVKFSQLFFTHGTRSVGQQALCALSLWKGDDVTDRFGARHHCDHAIETKQPIPEYPVVFTRAQTTLVGHGQPLVRPKASEQLDFEAELAVVIG